MASLDPAEPSGGLSLRARLLGLIAIATALLVSAATVIQVQITASAVERETLDAASVTALGVAADLTDRATLPTAVELEDLRAQFAQAVPTIHGLTVTRLEEDRNVLDTTTELSPPAEALELAQQATTGREIAVSDALPGDLRLVAVPLERDRQPYGAVVVAVSMERVARVRQDVRTAALRSAPGAILTLLLVIAFVGHVYLDRPLQSIRETMAAASAGRLDARAAVVRPDEFGRLAAGLNAMLDRMQGFNATLQDEVRRATHELQERNRLLGESAQRLFSARRELARAEQLAVAGRMAASVAHQIGTPLNLISGYVQMLLAEAPPASLEATRLRTVQEQIGRVAAIVQGLLDQARQPVLRKRAVPAAELAARVCDLAQPTLDQAGIILERLFERELPEVEVDPGQIEQVFLNLITNSIDAMPEGGVLRFAARAAAEGVEFVVTDSGQGIAPEDVARVFDPLFTTKGPGKGTGLGLTIVRDVLAAHGGVVSVASQPGLGTTFSVRLPRLDRAAPVAANA